MASYDSADGATTKAGSPSDKADNTVQRWTSTLSLERLLKGEALGLHLHHANKALGGLRTSSGESSVAYVLLKGHIDTFNSAMKLLPDAIEKTTAKQRQAILRDLLLAGVKIPLFTGANLLSQSVKEQRDDLKKVEMLTLKRVEGVEAEDGGEATLQPRRADLGVLVARWPWGHRGPGSYGVTRGRTQQTRKGQFRFPLPCSHEALDFEF